MSINCRFRVSTEETSTDSTIRGVVGEAGWMLGSSRSIGVEVTVPSRRSNIAQEYKYPSGPYRLEARYREQTIFGVFRAQVKTWRAVRVHVAGGGGFVRASSLDRKSLLNTQSKVYGPFSQEGESTSSTMGLTGGADLAVEIIPHVSVVPQFRLLIIDRGVDHLGLASVVYRVGVGIRAAF